MSPIKTIVSLIIIILMSATSSAQVDGYTCINEYIDCGDIVESSADFIQLSDFSGKPGDTVWLPVSLNVPSDTVDAFIILIDWDDAYLQPVPLPGDSVYLEYELAGEFALVADDFFVMLSQNPADEGAILALFNLGIGPYPLLPPGDHGVIFRLPFVVDLSMLWGATAAFGFQETNEYVVTDPELLEAFCADCRRTHMSIVHDCEVEIYDTVATDPLVIDTLVDTVSCSATLYPTTVGGTFTAQANGGQVYLHHVDGLVQGKIPTNVGPVTFHFSYHNFDPVYRAKSITNGYEVNATGGATWTVGTVRGVDFDDEFTWGPAEDHFNLVWSYNPFSWNGSGYDTLGVGGSTSVGVGLPPLYDGPAIWFKLDFTGSIDGETVCIDSCYYPPTGTWMWLWYVGGGAFPPDWDGPHCFDIVEIGPPPLVWTVVNLSYSGDHCDLVVLDYEVEPGDPINADPPATFAVLDGPGSVTSTGTWTCQYTYQPTLADVGASIVVILGAHDAMHVGQWVVTTTNLNFTNEAPVFTSGCGEVHPMCVGTMDCISITVDNVDCDPSSVSIVGVSPPPVGLVSLTPVGDNTWDLCFDSDFPGDASILFTVTVCVTDGLDTVCCEVYFDMIPCMVFEVQIEKTHNTLQGMHTIVDVTLNKGGEDMGGWDFLIAYDASALFFQAAIPGDMHTICGWEYFNYRYGPFGNCGNQCPSGLLRVVAIAETNNGANHPLCLSLDPKPVVLFSLDFLVSNDRTLECMYVPIRFFWMDCGDNSIAYHPADDPLSSVQAVSRYVIDFDLIGHIEDMYSGFPTYTGVQAECLVQDDPTKPLPVQFVDFLNGGVDIICVDSIDDRGDINLNGTSNEIADAVLFSNYFVKGIGVFNVNVQGQIAATDVNADGLTLSVADLVYQIRIIVGDALPYPKLAPVPASYTFNDGTLSVDSRMGAALAVFAGDITPTLLANNMDMRYHSDGAETRVLISKIGIGASFEGAFLQAESELLSLEMATYDGAPVVAKPLPEQFGLFQNYPNPFNPKTTIAFALPSGGEYSLTIFNVTGREVASFTGVAEAGQIETVEFDATDIASGVYFYRLDTDGFSQSRKMVLMK